MHIRQGLSPQIRRGKIKYVCIDMSNSYSAWVEKELPKARIVFDHFHVIKSMTERHPEGILGYWDFEHANSGSAEGSTLKSDCSSSSPMASETSNI